MGLNKLDNFIKNTEGRILYVSPSDLDSTDSISNQGNSLAQPFKTLQRALLEAARFSYQKGNSNDDVEKTTILLMPGAHTVDNRPGFSVFNDGGVARAVSPSGATSQASSTLTLDLNSVFDLTQENNILYKFNSINGGVIIPRGTSIVGLDLRKTKLRPKYVPNPTDSSVPNSAIFRITGACYFWQFCIFDGNLEGTVYTDPADFSVNNQSIPTFSHHKLTCFEYADGVNEYNDTGLTDLDMYYAKLSNAFNLASGRDIDQKYPQNPGGFEMQRPEWEIVGAFAADPIQISTIEAGSGGTPNSQVTVKTAVPHELTAGTPIRISGVSPANYNISTKVQSISETDPTVFTYLLPNFPLNLTTPGNASSAFVTIETDTVSGASPYIFNISLRSVYGMNGMLADGSKASGFRSMVVAQFTGVSLQKDDRAFVRYNPTNRNYSDSIAITREAGASLSGNSSSTNIAYHLEPLSIYRSGWETSHIKATNDAFIQVVSVFAIGFNKHFDAETGADLSITNSNSNFGQISLNSSGFKKEAFAKDNKAFITSIINPRTIVGEEDNIDWLQFDVAKTISAGNNTRLYLFGFTSPDDVPPILTQGYRIGAQVGDKLYFAANEIEYSANILMFDGISSSVKEYVSSVPSSNEFTLVTSGTHNIQTGEKVIILSDVGDLPENIVENTVYYAIRSSSTTIKLASSATAALNGTEIAVYGGIDLRILSRVSDKIAGDVEHPVQYDVTQSQWYITTNAGSDIYTAITNPLNIFEDGKTEPSYVKRTADSRSLDEKLYKIRVVIPKELGGAKNPEDGFVIQQTSSTGYRNNTDLTSSSITKSDYEYNKNLSLIAKCTRLDSTVTIISELPHNLQSGDSVIIKNVTDSTNTIGKDNRGYNGTFIVSSVIDDMTFTYATSRTTGTTFTNDTTSRTITSPRFERNNLQSNIYNYRNELITPYIEGIQDGVYHIYALIADKAVPTEFTNIKYSQNVVDLYPQLDRDNIHDNPPSAKSFAKRAPLGEVVTNDLKKSITRESINTVLTSFGVGLDISGVSNSTTSATITFARRHGLAGIVTYTGSLNNGTGSAGYNSGTYQNVKLLNGSASGTWQGATARVVVSAGGVASADIVSSGSGYSAGALYFDSSVLGNGNSNARFNISTSGITTAIGNVIQFTGDGTTSDTYHRITAVSADNQISIAKTTGDPVVKDSQYAFVLGPSVLITNTQYSSIDSSVGITTFNCSAPHGLVAGNKFRVIDSSSNNRGDYVVSDKIDIDSFTALTPDIGSVNSGYILKHGLSANGASSDSAAENLGTRSVTFFDKETLVAASGITTTATTVLVSDASVALAKRFPLGSYIQIDEEIMRVSSSNPTPPSGGTVGISVIRGVLATKQVAHDSGSLVRKIKPIPIEFRRPSIVRASGHTFEYLGYGPGNYSTGLPQVQVITLTEREEFLVQSQERSGGVVVYTGMNNNGDSFIGNRKTSSSTGEEITFDNPIPTVTGEDPSRLSVIFDEVTVKERLVVEGGNSGAVLSQFDGPVTFNKGIKFNDNVNVKSQLKVSYATQSTTTTNGALVVSGGVGIVKNLNVGGTVEIGDNLTVSGNVTLGDANTDTVTFTSRINSNVLPSVTETYDLGSTTREWNNVYANTFIGAITGDVTGNANTATTASNLTRSVTAGNGLTGGGSLNGQNVTLDVVGGSGGGITVAADSISVDSTVLRTTGSQSISGLKQFQSANTTIATGTGSAANLEVLGTGGAAFMQFHRPGAYAMYFGLDSDNQFKVGGWSAGATAYTILHSANYNTYSPTLTGTGASGQWNISAYPRRRGDGADLNFYWSGQSGQPTWLWGSNDGTNLYVWNPSNFSVSYATNAGNATTATNLTGDGSNWSTNARLTAVVGQLAWKNYGNGHTIFDASASTSPAGGAVNNTNAAVAWSSTYPTLMGWNGVSTYGVRVDSARISDTITNQANSATITATSATQANAIVLRDGNGDDFRRYGFGSYFNSTDDVSAGSISYIMAKFGNNYYRSATAEKVAAFLSGQSMNINGRAYPRRSDGADLNFYWSGQSGQPTWLWGSIDGQNSYVWNPSNFSVSYATSAGTITNQANSATITATNENQGNKIVSRDNFGYFAASGIRLGTGGIEITEDGVPIGEGNWLSTTASTNLTFGVMSGGGNSLGGGDIYSNGGSDGVWIFYNTSQDAGRMTALDILSEDLNSYTSLLRVYRNGTTGQRTVDCPYSGTSFIVNGTKSFRINHPIDENKDLIHISVEGPRADLIYRGTVKLENGTAAVNLDEEYELIPGTWKALCRDPQVWVTSVDGWEPCKGSVSNGILSIQSKDPNCTETVNWLVIAERQDDAMYNPGSDANGRPILEPDRYDPGS